jgi:hypothetical protein
MWNAGNIERKYIYAVEPQVSLLCRIGIRSPDENPLSLMCARGGSGGCPFLVDEGI